MSRYGDTVGTKFRLSICLKRFYSDERKRCYLSVMTGLRVRWLASRLRKLFSLSGHFCLLSAGHLLPPDENLGLLSPDDVVEVVPKYNSIFEETSESEDEQVYNTRNQKNNLIKKNEEERITIHKQNNTEGIYKPLNTQLKMQNQNNLIPGKSVFPFSNKQQLKENGVSQEEDHRESEEVDYDGLDVNTNLLEYSLVDQHSFSQDSKRLKEMVQWDEEIRTSQELEHENIDVGKTNELDKVKQKALELLEKCNMPRNKRGIKEVEEDIEEEDIKTKQLELVSQCDIPEKRKRKRVRRRKPRAVTESADVVDSIKDLPLLQTPDSHSRELGSHSDRLHKNSSVEANLSDALILRNNTEQNRIARLVYSLS